VDLSQSACFPPIANQGNTGACVAFATTYYQYSYEVNRLNNVTNVADRVIYSPKWIYNFANYGYDSGSSFFGAYNALKTVGALKYEDYPFEENGVLPSGLDFDELPEGLEEEKREAVNISCDVYSMIISCESTNAPIRNTNSSAVRKIKSALNDGKVLTGGVRWHFANSKTEYDKTDGDICYYEFTTSGSNHACTIVGYDDNIECDINGDGIIEDAECGAFKIANSYGTDEDNNGYFWVMYDALNYRSAVSGFQNDADRICAFRNDTGTISVSDNYKVNVFHYIDVAYDAQNIIAKVRVQTHNFNNLRFAYFYEDENGDEKNVFVSSKKTPPQFINTNYFDGTFFFNLGESDDDIEACMDEITWKIQTHELASNSSDYVITYLSLLDDKDNILESYGPTFDGSQSIYACYDIGDVNYDGSLTSADASLMMEFLTGFQSESRVQHYLGDFNQDGKFTVIDVVALNNYLGQTGAASAEEVAAINQEIADFTQTISTE
jgi:C1A family cysteine protease